MRNLLLRIENASMFIALMIVTGILFAAPPETDDERTPVRLYEDLLPEDSDGLGP